MSTEEKTQPFWGHAEQDEAISQFLAHWSEPMSRRTYLQRAGLVLSSAAAVLYGQAPKFWNQLVHEMNSPIEPSPFKPDPASWPDSGLFAAWLGHSTVLLKIDGFTILTDPVFSDRIGISLGLMTVGPKRVVEPALTLPELPQIDLILLSHAHMDHIDVPSLRALEASGTQVITAWETTDLLRPRRYKKVKEMRWGTTLQVGPVKFTAFEVRHWGARLRHDHHRGYNGYVLETARHKVVFAGDTAYTQGFRALKNGRPIDLIIVPIGAYDPFITNHCSPEQAWAMANLAGARYLLPVHHQTFHLSREPRKEPLQRILQAGRQELDRMPILQIGQEFRFA